MIQTEGERGSDGATASRRRLVTIAVAGVLLLAVVGILTLALGYGGREGESSPTHNLRIAAAASMRGALDQLSAAFEQAVPGTGVVVSYGASGNLVAQIRSGAPFGLFLSADTEYPRALVKDGLADESDLAVYARGGLVLWFNDSVPSDTKERGVKGLADDTVKIVAIANPEHAPYGKAAMKAIAASGLGEALSGKLVQGENVQQAAHFIQSGAADAGLIPASIARTMTGGSHSPLPTELCPKVDHAMVVLKGGPDAALARKFAAFVLSPEGQKIIIESGFASPGE